MRERQTGYQEALAHILAALNSGGEDRARAWIADNRSPEAAAIFARAEEDFS